VHLITREDKSPLKTNFQTSIYGESRDLFRGGKKNTATLFSLSAVAGVIAGVCIILGAILNDLLKTERGTIFNFLGALIGLFGITGFYLWQRVEFGIFGLVAYVLVFIGFVLIACIDYMGAFIAPGLSEEEMARMQQSSAMMVTMISGLIFLVSELLFGIAAFRANIFPRIATVLFMVGFLATPVRAAYPIFTFVGLTFSGIGIIWWGVTLFSLTGGF